MPVVLISAGIGVTPLLSMLRAHVAREDAPPVIWLHATRNGESHVLRAEVDRVLAKQSSASRRIYYSSPSSADRHGIDYDHSGRLTSDAIASLLKEVVTISLVGRPVEMTVDFAQFYICGPRDFETMVRDALTQSGVNGRRIFSESFISGDPVAGRASAFETAKVEFRRSGREVVWSREDDLSLLELSEKAGVAVSSGCRMGLCQTCEAAIVEGSIIYDRETAAVPAAGHVLLCCARPNSEQVILDL